MDFTFHLIHHLLAMPRMAHTNTKRRGVLAEASRDYELPSLASEDDHVGKKGDNKMAR